MVNTRRPDRSVPASPAATDSTMEPASVYLHAFVSPFVRICFTRSTSETICARAPPRAQFDTAIT